MTTVKYLSTKETAVLLRQALKAAFKGTKFSVRMGTGTGSSWVSVNWTDGPTDLDVTSIVETYAGKNWNINNDDSYTEKDSVLVCLDGKELPELVRFGIAGINTHRDMSDIAVEAITQDIKEALGGTELLAKNLDFLEVNGAYIKDAYDVRNAIHQVFYHTDMRNRLAAVA